jgi:hypothetical protein
MAYCEPEGMGAGGGRRRAGNPMSAAKMAAQRAAAQQQVVMKRRKVMQRGGWPAGFGDCAPGMGKKQSFFKKVASQAKAGVRSAKGVAKVAGGSIGFKKGLTEKQKKKSGFLRKALIAGAAIGATIAVVAVTGGAAAPFLMAKGPLLLSAAAKVKAARDKISAARRAAGLAPITYNRTPEEEVQAAAATIPNAPELSPEQVTAKAGLIAESAAAQNGQVNPEITTSQVDARSVTGETVTAPGDEEEEASAPKKKAAGGIPTWVWWTGGALTLAGGAYALSKK